jgi:CHAT domain-containing protein
MLCRCILAAAALLPLAATAQTLTCAPVPSRQHAGLAPLISGPFADASILTELQQAYRTLYSFPDPDALKSAHAQLTQTLTLSTSTQNRCGEALASYALGDIAERNDFSEAASWFERAVTAFTAASSSLGIAKSHFRLADVHSIQGHEAQSRQEYAAAAQELEQANDPQDAIRAWLSAPDESTGHGYASLLARAQTLNDPCLQATVLRIWGDRNHHDAKYQTAMEHYQAADRLYQQCPSGFSNRAALQTSMGRLERQQGRPAAALPHYRLALKLQGQSGDPSYIPQTYNAMAVAYEAMNDLPHAIALYKLGLYEARRLHSQPFIDFLSANLGSTYARSGHAALGVPLLEAVTQHLSSDLLTCIRFDQLGNAYRLVKRYKDAAASLNTALPACQREMSKDNLTEALDDRALIEIETGQLDAAWTDASRALSIVEEFRAHLVQTDAYKRGYITAAQTHSTYDLAITVLMHMKRYQQALEVAEQGRARALLDLLASEQSGAPHASSTSAFTGAIASPEHTGALTVPEMLGEASRLHTTLIAYWLTDSELFTWVARPGEPVLGFAQAVKPHTIERLIRATLPAAQLNLVPASPSTPENEAPAHLEAIAARGSGADIAAPFSAAWRRLYTLLLAPIASQLPTGNGALLTIVPSGPLFRVSFAALIDPHGHYLVERFRTNTIPMVGLLRYTEHNATVADSLAPHYLFIAAPNHPPTGPDGLPLPALPGTAAEVRAVAALLPPPQVTVLSGDEAVPLRVERDAPNATILHFATHAIVDNDHPEKTFLALDDAHGTGRLTLDDVYALHLHARLVVLSACRTGLGKITGDGVAGLSRAFFYAGSASVLTTLWDVADKPTAIMLPRFYSALQRGQSPSEALRSAQLSMLNDLRRGRIRVETLRGSAPLAPSPAYWAAFTLSGEP